MAAMKINQMLVSQLQAGLRKPVVQFELPELPKGVIPAKAKLAMDRASNDVFNYANLGFNQGLGLDGQAWLGFPALAQLSQRAEFRMMTETLSKEMTRKFVKLKSTGGDADPKKIKILEAEVKRFKCRQVLKKGVEHDGFFGRGQIFIRTTAGKVNTPLVLDKATFKKGALQGFLNIEPMWSYPGNYNSTDPLDPSWYVPDWWWVQGDHVDSSRLITIVTRPVSDILKPAYAFAGLSLSQLALEYVNNWVRTRNSVGDIVHSFSLTILKTNMGASLSGSCDDDLINRMVLFNLMRDNRGAFVCDKDSEEIEQINTPLAGLADLQAQAQEQLASVSHIPLVKLLGTTPKGLNASADPEVKSFYDFIASDQEDNLSEPFQIMLNAIQLNKFGEIDPDITFEWAPLWQMDDEAQSRIRKSNADADQIYQTMGAVSTEEVREKVAADPTSGYSGLDLTEMPEPEDDDEQDPESTEPPANSSQGNKTKPRRAGSVQKDAA